jgi:small ligand-binding sensory domain FIST
MPKQSYSQRYAKEERRLLAKMEHNEMVAKLPPLERLQRVIIRITHRQEELEKHSKAIQVIADKMRALCPSEAD